MKSFLALALVALTVSDQSAVATNSSAPRLFGCADYTASGCATCFNHKELGQHVCTWCLLDNQCHDVGSIESDCTGPQGNDHCISIAVKTNCNLHNISACPAPPPATPQPSNWVN
jgi:hypothetical protein